MKSTNRFGYLSQRVFNTPLAIQPAKAEIIVGALADRLGITAISRGVMAFDPYDDDDDGDGNTYREPGYEVEMGIAKIDIEGTTVMKLGGVRPMSGMTGYNGIRQNLLEAAADVRVKAIMLDIDSPGGEVAGMFDMAKTIRAVDQDVKPVFSVLTEGAYSAAYCLASATRKIYVPQTGGVGSIGVVWMHCDFSKAIKEAGVKVTFVTRGARKVDGAEELPLSDEAMARAQKDIDTIGGMFEATVALNRGLSATKIRDMEAGTFLGAEGVTVGLADAVMAPDEAFQDILEAVG
jgi:ClpP class serine protease